MRKYFFLFLFFSLAMPAQTIPGMDPQLQPLPTLPEQMSYEEFQKLNREINWSRLMAAAVVPGYLHFYADAPDWGWSIAGARIIGTGLMTWAMYDQYDRFGGLTNFSDSVDGEKSKATRNLTLFLAGLGLNMIGFGLDWAHADLLISEERMRIQYKYRKQYKLEIRPQTMGQNGAGIGLNLTF
jgi:hypothetical protein